MSPYLLILLPGLLLLLLALFELRVCGRHLHHRHMGRAATHGLMGCCLLLAALLLAVIAASIYHYQRLSEEEIVARLTLRELEPQRFAARLETATGDHRSFEVHGDQWQLDARVLRWRTPAVLAGAPNLYRLERLSGRYRDISQEREAVRSAHDLAADAFPDLWTLRQQFPQWLGFVDADYGSGAYMPMLDGARFEVSLGPRGGLVARAADPETERRLQQSGW
jgi:hypothetical protein